MPILTLLRCYTSKNGCGLCNFVYRPTWDIFGSVKDRERQMHFQKFRTPSWICGGYLLPLNTTICSPAILWRTRMNIMHEKSPERILLSFVVPDLWWHKWPGEILLPSSQVTVRGLICIRPIMLRTLVVFELFATACSAVSLPPPRNIEDGMDA